MSLPSLRVAGFMLGLILGRSRGLACAEFMLWRFLAIPALVSGFLEIGTPGDTASKPGLGAIELGSRSSVPELGSTDGVPLVDMAGVEASVCVLIFVFMRGGLGRDSAAGVVAGVAASGNIISCMASSSQDFSGANWV